MKVQVDFLYAVWGKSSSVLDPSSNSVLLPRFPHKDSFPAAISVLMKDKINCACTRLLIFITQIDLAMNDRFNGFVWRHKPSY